MKALIAILVGAAIYVVVALHVAGPIQAQLATGSHPVTLSAVTNSVLALSPNNTRGGALMQFYCSNANATAFIELFDATNTAAVTLGTTVPVWAAQIQANTQVSFQLPIGGVQFGQGIMVAASNAFNGSGAPGGNLSCAAAYY